jgi:hypothetical protein
MTQAPSWIRRMWDHLGAVMQHIVCIWWPRGATVSLKAAGDPAFPRPPAELSLGVEIARRLQHTRGWLLWMAAMLYGCRRGLNINVLDNPPLVSDDDITKAHMLGRLSGIGAAARNTDEENMFNAGEAVLNAIQ